MKHMTKMLAASALAVAASASQAALYDINVMVDGALTGSFAGTMLGSASGVYDSVTGDMTFSGDFNLVVAGLSNITVASEWAVNGLTGTQTFTACTFNSGLDLCAGIPAFSVPPLALNVPLDMGLTSNTVIAGNGELISSFSFSDDAGSLGLDTTYTITGTLSPVPVPAAAWLFGSAVLGLVGVRRNRR